MVMVLDELATRLPVTDNAVATPKEAVVVPPLALITRLPYDWLLLSAATVLVVPAYSMVLVAPKECVL
jgi:hypothetical protein